MKSVGVLADREFKTFLVRCIDFIQKLVILLDTQETPVKKVLNSRAHYPRPNVPYASTLVSFQISLHAVAEFTLSCHKTARQKTF